MVDVIAEMSQDAVVISGQQRMLHPRSPAGHKRMNT